MPEMRIEQASGLAGHVDRDSRCDQQPRSAAPTVKHGRSADDQAEQKELADGIGEVGDGRERGRA